MNCPRCEAESFEVTHSYSTPGGQVQRRECSSCLTVGTTRVVLVNVDPSRGEGARAHAQRLREKS